MMPRARPGNIYNNKRLILLDFVFGCVTCMILPLVKLIINRKVITNANNPTRL